MSLQHIIHYVKEYHPLDESDLKKIENAFQLMMDCFSDSKIDGGIVQSKAYCQEHSVAVAQYVASWRFDYTVVIAALLHELPVKKIKSLADIKPHVDESVYRVLEGYVRIHEQLISTQFGHYTDEDGTGKVYLNNQVPESLYIEIAEHVDILSRNKNDGNEEALDFARKTRENLIPQVMHINAYRLVDMLEELCFKIENGEAYQRIYTMIQKVNSLNAFYRHQFIKKLEHIFDKNSNITAQSLKIFQPYIKLLSVNRRSVISIYRFITQLDPSSPYNSTFQLDLEKINNFYRTAYDELTLVLDDDILSKEGCTVVDVFLKYFETMLQPEGAFLYGYYYTTNRNSCYFLLSDPMKNMYRFFVQSESDYLYYLYGNIISRDKFDLNYSSKTHDSEIKVFRKDGTAEIVEKGITVLDFAFKIHEDLGLHFGGAILNKNNRPLPAYTVISNGDTVEIIKSEKITADLNWFRYLKTDLAINYLIKYFKIHFKCET